MSSADPADRGEGNQAAGGSKKETGQGPSCSGIGNPGEYRRSIAIVEDDDGQAYSDQQSSTDALGQIDIEDLSAHTPL